MSIFKNANDLLEEQTFIPKQLGVCKYCGRPVLDGERYVKEKRMDGDSWHSKCGSKDVVIEEAVTTPIDFAINIGNQLKRITRLLKSKGWTPAKKQSSSEFINMGFTGRVDSEIRVSILSLPNASVIDTKLNEDPKWIPMAILTNFYSEDSGSTWERYQEIFVFDNVKDVKKTASNIMEYCLEDVYEYQDMIKSGSKVGGPWERVVKNPKSIKVKESKTIG